MKTSLRRRLTAAASLLAAGAVSAIAPLSAQAVTIPPGDLVVRSNAGIVQFQAGPALNHNAGLFLGKALLGGGVTPSNMRFGIFKVASTAQGDAYAICSQSVSGPLGGVVSCLDVVGDSKSAGAKLAIKPFDKSLSQRWVIRNQDSIRPATVTLMNVNSGLYVDTGATPTAGDRPTQQKFVAPSSQDNRGARQQFFIKTA